MSLVDKIKLLLQLRKPGQELVTQVKEAKSGWKTIHFWVALLGTLTTIAGVVAHFIPATAGLLAMTTVVVIYNIVRSIENAHMPGVQPLLLSTRFWIGIIGIVGDGLMALKTGGISYPWVLTSSAIIASIMAAAQSVGAEQPSQSPS